MTSIAPRLRRGVAAAAAAVAMALALSACGAPIVPLPSQSQAPEEPAPVTDGVADELLPFYDQRIEWGECEQQTTSAAVQCATVTAPLDWDDPGAGEIELGMARPADVPEERVGALLINPGGPGASGADYLFQAVEYEALGQPLFENFSVVGFDPRGVGMSTPVTCLDPAQMDAFLYDIPSGERGSTEWEDALAASAEEFAEGCGEKSGEVLEFITTEQSARDMDLLRAVLGDRELHYLGFSYGTYLGATYAELFPDRAGRLVLDGAVDPSVPAGEVGMTQVIAFEQSLRTYLGSCLDGAECPFRGDVDQALGELRALLESADRDPLSVPDGRTLGGDALMTGVTAALYSQQNWPILTEGLALAMEGDGSTMMFLADFYNGRDAQGRYESNSTEAFHAYNCMDYPAESDEAWEEQKEILADEAPTIWDYMLGADVCEFWPYPPSGTRDAISAEGAPPIVVIGTTGDPATPFAWAESLSAQLDSGVLVKYEGEGHTAYASGSTCIDDAVEAFLVGGAVPDDGLTC